MSPYRIRTGKEHDISIFVPFGCLATVHIKAKDRGGKLRPAADVGVYLGHGERSDGGLQGYRVYKYATNKVVIRHDVSFNCTLPAMKYISTVTATSADAQFLNRTISKRFGKQQQHHGIVHSHRKDSDGLTLWAIHYDDDDWEEMHLAELVECLNPSSEGLTAALRNTRLQHIGHPSTPPPDIPTATAPPSPPATTAAPPLAPTIKASTPPTPTTRRSKRKRKTAKPHNISRSNTPAKSSYNHEYRLSKSRAVKCAKIFGITPGRHKRPAPNSPLPPTKSISSTTKAKSLSTPSTHRQARTSPYRDYWEAAESKEVDSLIAKGTWTVERPTHTVKVIRGAFVYKIKELEDGTIEKFKARYCAKGYSQIPGVHYRERFAPVASATAIRAILLSALEYN